jgi:hypothetical protein
MLNQLSPISQPQRPASQKSSSAQLDFTFSPRLPSYIPALLPQQMQPPSTPATSYPPSEYEIIRDYKTGSAFPNRYLNRLRDSVDPTFSNHNWGDEYYFSDATPFTYIEDTISKPHLPAYTPALHWGLKRRADAVPLRPEDDMWKSYQRTMDRLVRGDGERKHPSPSLQEMEQNTRSSPIHTERHRPLPLNLEPSVQAQEMMDFPGPTQGMQWPSLIAPAPHPFRIGTALLAISSTRSEMAADVVRSDSALRSDIATVGDASLHQEDEIWAGAATAESEDVKMRD